MKFEEKMIQSRHFYPLFPDLLENQKKSVNRFWSQGLVEEFELFSYVSGKKKNLYMIFHGAKFFVQKPLSSFESLVQQQKTYSVSLFVPIEFQWLDSPIRSSDLNPMTKIIQKANLLPIYFGEVPLMTERGSFLINGSARVLVNQIVRCPNLYFKVKIDQKNRRTYIGSFLSEYGSWLRVETDYKNRIWVRIDKSQRISIYALFRSLGFPESFLKYQLKNYSFLFASQEDYFSNKPNEAIQFLWKKLNPGRWNSLQGCYSFFYNKFFHPRKYSIGTIGRLRLNKRLARKEDPFSSVSESTSWISKNSKAKNTPRITLPTLTPEDIFMAVELLIQFHYGEGILDDIDHLKNRRVRLPGELMQNQLRLALSRLTQAASEKLSKFELEFQSQTLSEKNESIFSQSKLRGSSLKNFLQTQIFGSTFRELFNTSQLSQYMDQTNPLAEITHKRRLSSLGPGGIGRDQAGFAVREIHPSHFGRICPIETPEGPNAGLVGSLATYSRITPEGFLQSPYYQYFSDERVDLKFGQKEKNDWFLFLAEIEDEAYICSENLQAKLNKTPEGFQRSRNSQKMDTLNPLKYPIRYKQEFLTVEKNQIEFFGVSPIQMISLATSLIPFLEHDDANRALMGSNMQRQAVPLLFAEKPFVGTGLEVQAARDSSTMLLAKESGQIVSVDGFEINIRTNLTERSQELGNSNGIHNYSVQKYWRSNQNTCLRQTPRVRVGEWVEKGDLLADGSATFDGEIALGKNILVAYMPWEGYNFEDAIVINERLVQEDIYTSIHIDRYDVETRETDHGKEQITRDLNFLSFGKLQTTTRGYFPNFNSRFLDLTKNELDVVKQVSDGSSLAQQKKDSLSNQLSDEFKANEISFFENNLSKTENSERLETQNSGLASSQLDVFGVFDVFGKAKTVKTAETTETAEVVETLKQVNNDIQFADQSLEHLDERGIIFPGTWVEEGDILVGKITPISPPKPTPEYRLLLAIFETKPLPFKDTSLRLPSGVEGRVLECLFESNANLPNIPEKVQVFLAHKRKIQLGDKMSGRHGNKGIVSLILPPQDMPFLQDGTPVDIVLNPLGVPSRMNVGQVLECLFGLATKYLKQNYRLLAFDEIYGTDASRGLVYTKLFEAACQTGYQWLFDPNHPGKSHLFDGRTGEAFHQPVLIGYSYMFKLIHLVDEKIHARSTGPYSLVTQQPLGGRSKHGGQRLGEMEVWALEGFGAASILHEFLTLKSDDIDARNTFLFHLMKRRQFPQERLRRCLPESFRVLVHELQSLCLSVYYNPDFRLTYPSLLGWDGLFLLSSKKFPSLHQLGQLKIA